MSHRRDVAIALNEELGVVVPEFQVGSNVAEGPVAVGRRLREALRVSVEEQQGWRDEWHAWRRWRSAVEDAGVLVFQFPKVSLDQARGVSLLHFPLPAIGINSKEQSPGARVFTLLHELAHVSLAIGRDEQVALRERTDDEQWAEVERFAEEAASEAIIPAEALAVALRSMPPNAPWDVARVRALAVKFRVTPLAMATRLRAAGTISWDGYRVWKSAWNDYVATLKPRGGGIATPVDKTLGRGGRPFAQLVLEALDANRITAVEASQHLDLRFDHVDELRSELRTWATGSGAGDHA